MKVVTWEISGIIKILKSHFRSHEGKQGIGYIYIGQNNVLKTKSGY